MKHCRVTRVTTHSLSQLVKHRQLDGDLRSQRHPAEWGSLQTIESFVMDVWTLYLSDKKHLVIPVGCVTFVVVVTITWVSLPLQHPMLLYIYIYRHHHACPNQAAITWWYWESGSGSVILACFQKEINNNVCQENYTQKRDSRCWELPSVLFLLFIFAIRFSFQLEEVRRCKSLLFSFSHSLSWRSSHSNTRQPGSLATRLRNPSQTSEGTNRLCRSRDSRPAAGCWCVHFNPRRTIIGQTLPPAYQTPSLHGSLLYKRNRFNCYYHCKTKGQFDASQ